jgi:hypothetical protein
VSLKTFMAGDELSMLVGAMAEGDARGKDKGSQEAVCKYLEARFGEPSRGLQRQVKRIDKSEIPDKIINKIYTAGSLEDAGAIIDGAKR